MPNSKIKQIREALKTVLQKIRVAQGYSVDILPAAMKRNFSAKSIAQRQDGDYPKIFVQIDSGDNKPKPSGRYEKEIIFIVIAVVKKQAPADPDPEDAISDLIDDIDKVINANDTLENTVIDAQVENFTTDSGVLNPEGVALIQVKVLYHVQR